MPLVSLLAAAALTLCPSAGPRDNCVVDGDTFWFAGEKFRLADIDAPETEHAKCSSERARGERAKLRLLELLNAAPFRLDRQGHDQYGRVLAKAVNRNGSIGTQLVDEGLARRWTGRRQPWC